MLTGIDGNSAAARRYKDLVLGLTADLPAPLTQAELLQVRTAAGLQLQVEDLTARLVRGEQVDPETMTRASNGATRALNALKRGRASKRPAGQGALSAFLADRQARSA